MNNEDNLTEQTKQLARLVIAVEEIARRLEVLTSTVLTVEDQRGNDYKAVATTKID
jgi:hypothetical protein